MAEEKKDSKLQNLEKKIQQLEAKEKSLEKALEEKDKYKSELEEIKGLIKAKDDFKKKKEESKSEETEDEFLSKYLKEKEEEKAKAKQKEKEDDVKKYREEINKLKLENKVDKIIQQKPHLENFIKDKLDNGEVSDLESLERAIKPVDKDLELAYKIKQKQKENQGGDPEADYVNEDYNLKTEEQKREERIMEMTKKILEYDDTTVGIDRVCMRKNNYNFKK